MRNSKLKNSPNRRIFYQIFYGSPDTTNDFYEDKNLNLFTIDST
jgi:hypothetical protein